MSSSEEEDYHVDEAFDAEDEVEANDDDSCAGDLQLWLSDDTKVKPSDRTLTMINLAQCYIKDFSTDVAPFNHKVFDKCKKQHKTHLPTLKKEVKRRDLKFAMSNKTMAEVLEFLQDDDNKLSAKDLSYLERQVGIYKTACEARINEQEGSATNVDPSAPAVNITMDDWYRVVEALLCDTAKAHMLKTQECLTRPELDARNSAVAVADYFDIAANMFNDKTWVPHTTAMPDLHPDLAESRALPLKEYRMTRTKMKEKYDSLKKRLHGMVGRWERSGNGGMQRDDSAPDWGHFDLEQVTDGDNRANFLPAYDDGRVCTDYYLLYFWERLDKEGYVQFTLA